MPRDPKPTDPQPGTDYYVEKGSYVFTAAYLAKRGFCCGNGCRHCPYEGLSNDGMKRDRSITAARPG